MIEPNTEVQTPAQRLKAAAMLMPRYKCHKTVGALKIEKIFVREDGSAYLNLVGGFMVVHAAKAYMSGHDPVVGGYFIIPEAGPWSYSPAGPFEAGYTRIES